MYRPPLVAGIAALPVPTAMDECQIDLLLGYHQLLVKWNKSYNLTAVRDPLQMISRHLLDSLSIAPYLRGDRFLDVGTGAGLPGIVLAILYPQRQFDLLDSNGKNTRFLFQVKTQLKLANVAIHQCRVEQHSDALGYDGIISRAFASLNDMVLGSGQLLKPEGHFYAMKGLYPAAEIEQLNQMANSYKVDKAIVLEVPGEEAERQLIVIANSGS
jgi:16S rRNA (guanine527-N7)-methyltransferase